MKKSFVKIVLVLILLGLLPASGAQAQAAIAHPFDNSVLLMISSQMRLDGEVQSALLPGGRMLALSRQAANGNEIDVLIQLYADQIAKLRASDDYDPDLEAKLISQLEDKVDALHRQAQELKASRSQRRGGLFGFINRGLKGLGRATGWLMGKAMDGAGDIAEFAIEDVAPQVLKEALQNGAPLNAVLVRRVARELLINRVADAIARDRQKRAERLAEVDSDPTADATWEADFMEAFEEGDESQNLQGNTESSAGGSTGSTGSDILIYDFNASDFYSNRWEGDDVCAPICFGWYEYWAEIEGTGFCPMKPFVADTAMLHLEFNQQKMTVSGYLEASFEESATWDTGERTVSGSFRVEFSDLETYEYTSTSPDNNGIVLSYRGEGSGKGTISGTTTCRQYSEAINDSVYIPTRGQSTNDLSVPITIWLRRSDYLPSLGANITLNFMGGAMPDEGFQYSFDIPFVQPFDELLP